MRVRLPARGSRHHMTQLWFATSTEEYLPDAMLEQAEAAERAGFDALGTSDHWAPWFPDGRGTQAWVYLGAVGQRTTKPIGTGVTPVVHHYHPGLGARAFGIAVLVADESLVGVEPRPHKSVDRGLRDFGVRPVVPDDRQRGE